MEAYINFLKQAFPDWEITNELNINWDGKSTIMILKSTVGTDYVNSSVVPFQLIVITDDVPNTLDKLNVFRAAQQDQYFISNYVWYKQYYYTPVVPTIATPTGNTLTSQVLVSGILTASDNISDISKVEISVNNGTSYETVVTQIRDLVYSCDGEAQININDNLNYLGKRNNKGGTVAFNFSLIAQNTNFCKKLRDLRQGALEPNATFLVRFTFTDTGVPGTYPSTQNEVYKETYTCKVVNYQYHGENSRLPNYTVAMQSA